MLKVHGEQLIHSDPIDLIITGDHPDTTIALRRCSDGSQFFFLRNANQNEARSGSITVEPKDGNAPVRRFSYDLSPFGAKILYIPVNADDNSKGEWLPRGRDATPPANRSLPNASKVTITSTTAVEPADRWRDLPEQKALTGVDIFDQRYVHYRATFTLTDHDLRTPIALRVMSVGGSLVAHINGKEIASTTQRGTNADVFPLVGNIHAGKNFVEILFENRGSANGGTDMELGQGITRVSLIPSALLQPAVSDWRMKFLAMGDTNISDRAEFKEAFDDRNWQKVSVDGPGAISTANTSAIYRGVLGVSKKQLASGVTITFGTIDDAGIFYVNGQKAGTADTWTHPWTFDITPFLHEGDNVLALLVKNDGGIGGLYNGAFLDPSGTSLTDLQVAPETQPATIPIDPTIPRRFLIQYSLEFTLGGDTIHIVPWKFHLDADANAFISLNGHLLGRYWSIGAQHDFWLPECWLIPGKNSITLCARPTKEASADQLIKKAHVEPYITDEPVSP